MKKIFDIIKQKLDSTERQHHYFNFYDLGSGAGNSTLAAMLQLSFKTAVGIEILSGLYDMSMKLKRQWDIKSKYDCKLDFIHGSLLEDWTFLKVAEPCIIFANSTCFNDEMFAKITENCKQLMKGSMVITLSVPLVVRPTAKIRLLKEMRAEMSWAETDVFIHTIH